MMVPLRARQSFSPPACGGDRTTSRSTTTITFPFSAPNTPVRPWASRCASAGTRCTTCSASLVDTPFNGGPPTWIEDLELIVKRHGFPEESHFTVAYSPVPDDTAPRGIGGVLATVHEITDKVIGQRRVAALSQLSARLAEAKTDEDACRMAIDVLSKHPKDLPFALVYLLDEATGELRQADPPASTSTLAGPQVTRLDSTATELAWPVVQALRTETPQTVESLASVLSPVPAGPWPYPTAFRWSWCRSNRM